jgi:hypothetical protein
VAKKKSDNEPKKKKWKPHLYDRVGKITDSWSGYGKSPLSK